MNLIDKQLERIKKENRLGLMTHVVLGYPSLKVTESLVTLMEEAGADFIELQIPFSDPLADGPTIMGACETALKNGIKVKDAFGLAKELRSEVKIPLLFMAYYNTVFRYGTRKFCRDAVESGISGLIIPDLPPEEEHTEHFIKYCREAGLKNIRVVSPVSTTGRLRKNIAAGNGFVYCTARQGITGVRRELNEDIGSFLRRVKEMFDIPLCVGFGISKKEDFGKIVPYADIAVIGSAIIDLIRKSERGSMKKNVREFLKKLKD